MQQPDPSPRLIIVGGLPDAGKTTHAERLAAQPGVIRFCPDAWMAALALDLYDEDRRARIEALQWEIGQGLLAAGLTLVIEWWTLGRSERDALRLGVRALGAAVELHFLSAPPGGLIRQDSAPGHGRPADRVGRSAAEAALFQAPTAAEAVLFDAFVARRGQDADRTGTYHGRGSGSERSRH